MVTLGEVPMRFAITFLFALACASCAETVQFQPKANQQALIRDGVSALVSRRPNSMVMIQPAGRQFQAGGRPVFVVGINNLSNTPFNFLVANVQVTQSVNGQPAALKVITYEDLVQEERTRQVVSAILVGAAAAGNSMSAANAGYYNANSTVYTPRGTYNVQTTGYSPAAAAIAQSNANLENEAMISATVARGQENMTFLERAVIKDNTLMPGEWYGGRLYIQPLAWTSNNSPKVYQIALTIGPDTHEIQIAQATAK
jgi:hypothetical protein